MGKKEEKGKEIIGEEVMGEGRKKDWEKGREGERERSLGQNTEDKS